MGETYDMERAWQAKLARCLDETAGRLVREQVMAGGEALSDASSRRDVIAWSQQAMQQLDVLVREHDRQAIMLGCACHYPKESLQPIRQYYARTGDADIAHQMLQEQFEMFLRDTLLLDEKMIAEVVGRGWGAAGIKRGDTVIATKIPKSGYLVEYLQETDPKRRREIYCHCPRIRDGLKMEMALSSTYCYCGAGFYQGIWEEILQRSVEVELLQSILRGDEVCQVAIHLNP